MNYIGIDVGTSGCKAVVFDDAGRQLSSANREYELVLTPDGGAELDSAAVLDRCIEAIKEAAAAAGAGSVRSIGISSQGEAFTSIDKDGHPLGHAMVSSDTRSEPFARKFPAVFGEQRLYEITGHTAHPMFTLFKLLWLKQNKPAVWNRAARFLCFEDLLQLRLGLDPAMGWPLAGRTMMFDVRRHRWCPEILAEVGITADQLARPLPAGANAGTVRTDLAAELGLAEGAFVVTGGHDQPCGALGAGVTEPGVAMYATGSVECITPAFRSAVFTDQLRRNNLCTYDHAVPGMHTTVAFCLTGGNILKWFRDEFGREGEDYPALLKTMPAEPTALQVLPYWTPSGTPHFDLHTAGAIVGLRLSTKRGEIIKGLLEGVAMEMRLNLEILRESGCDIKELRAIGGGAKSTAWTQLKADVLGRPITTLDVTEAGCLGAAMLACAADTGRSLTELAAAWVRPVATVEPDRTRTAVYAERMQYYRKLYRQQSHGSFSRSPVTETRT